ncbi:MAG: hypothetical protein RR268_07200, partial [Kiritimatiellia bacterium]
ATIAGTGIGGTTLTYSSVSDDKRTVTFTASAALPTAIDLTVTFTALPGAGANAAITFQALGSGAAENVPEAFRNGFSHRKTLTIGTTSNFGGNAPTYADGAGSTTAITTPGRVAYYMELQRAGEPVQFVWASMDAFDTTEAKLYVPTNANGNFQGLVTNLQVYGNRGNFNHSVSGAGESGFIEFTARTYDKMPCAVSGAPRTLDNTLFDWNDTLGTGGGYGCMQLSRILPSAAYAPAEPLFAFNGFSTNKTEIGIGSLSTGIALDYTLISGWDKYQATAYSVRKMEIWVAPSTTPTTATWTATGTNDTWSDASHWSGNTVPTAGNVIVNFAAVSNATLTIDRANVNLECLTIEATGSGTNRIAVNQTTTTKNLVLGRNLTIQTAENIEFRLLPTSFTPPIALAAYTLTKSGAGTLTLNHAKLTASTGKIVVQAGALNSTGTATWTNSGAFSIDVASGATCVLSNTFVNNGGFTKTGAGTLTQAGAMSGNGALAVNGGTLTLTAQNTRAGGATTIASGATLEVLGNAKLYGGYQRSSVTVRGTLSISNFAYGGSLGELADNDGYFSLYGGGTLNIQETTSSTRGIDVIVNSNQVATIQVAVGKELTIAASTGTRFKVDAPLTFSGAGNVVIAHTITGSGALTLAGTGSVAFNSTAAVSNAITVESGATITGTANLTGALSLKDGSTLQPGTAAKTFTNAVAMAGAVTLNATQDIVLNGAAVTATDAAITVKGTRNVTFANLTADATSTLAVTETATVTVGTLRPKVASIAAGAKIALTATVDEIKASKIEFPTSLTAATGIAGSQFTVKKPTGTNEIAVETVAVADGK